MKPILFNTEMVRAILDGRKTVTRRVVKPQPPEDFLHCQKAHDGSCWWWNDRDGDDDMMRWWPSYDNGLTPSYRPGDILYVRETWALHECNDRLPISCKKTEAGRDCYIYRADGVSGRTPCGVHPSPHPWRPSIHMPREAARIFLRVTAVRVERLQNITPTECVSEGLEQELVGVGGNFIRGAFSDLWDSTIKPADRALYGWAANPWVWVVAFERCDGLEEPSP